VANPQIDKRSTAEADRGGDCQCAELKHPSGVVVTRRVGRAITKCAYERGQAEQWYTIRGSESATPPASGRAAPLVLSVAHKTRLNEWRLSGKLSRSSNDKKWGGN